MKTLIKHGLLLMGLSVLAVLPPARADGQDAAPATTAAASKQVANAPKGLRVYFCSHSLMWYVPRPLAELAEASGIQDHKLVGLQSLGGSTTEQHWNLPDERNEAKKALKTGEVDVLVMSPIGLPDPAIENFVKLGLQHNPNMRFIVQVSWAAWDADMQTFGSNSTRTVERDKTPDQLKEIHEANIKAAEAQAGEINRNVGKVVLYLVPSAQASIALRTAIYNKALPGLSQGELFRDAISHPSPPLEALNTYLHYAVLYGKSPVGLPMPSLLKNANRPAWDDKLNQTLQEIAWQAVTSYPYSGITASPMANGK